MIVNKKISVYALVLFLSMQYVLAQQDRNGTFGYDMELVLASEKNIVLLTRDSAQLIISPNYQARILTSTSKGLTGRSYGWLNQETLKTNSISKTKKSYGGEDRFWLNPLGSSFTLYYDQKEINAKNWTVPKLLETETFTSIRKTDTTATFSKKATILNNIGTQFQIEINRYIELYSQEYIEKLLDIKIESTMSFVGFGSKNSITNIGENWNQSTGLIAPWVLGMFPGNPESVALIPYIAFQNKPLQLQKYLSEFDRDRVIIKNNIIYFKTDGSYRSKIGIKPENTLPVLGNFDAKNKVLTIVVFSLSTKENFLNSTETSSSNIFGGDAVNSYNNAVTNGAPTFFELETAAAAKALKKGEYIVHSHKTFHFEGTFEALNTISKKVLNCDLKDATAIFK